MIEKQIRSIALDKIEQVENSRITYAKEEMAELMVSMKQRGLLTPIGVRKNGARGHWEVVFGNRRLAAAKKLDWKTIDCIELTGVDSGEEMLLTNAVENMQRVDVPYAEQGRIFWGLKKAGLSTKEIAARIGVDAKRVEKMVDMYASLPERYRVKVVKGTPGLRFKGGQIPATTAGLAVSLGSRLGMNKEQIHKILDTAGEQGMTGDKMRRVAGLVRAGRTLNQALSQMEDTKMVTISIAIPIEHIKRLQRDRKAPIHKILYDHLTDQKWLGCITAGSRIVLRKKGKK